MILCVQITRIGAASESARRRILADVAADLLIISDRMDPDFDAEPPALYLDPGRLPPADGLRLARGIVTRLADLHPRVGLAAGKRIAAIAATHADPIALVTPERAAKWLAPLPVADLDPGPTLARRLRLLGIERVGEFAALPRSAVLAQFKRQGRELHLLACGDDHSRITPAPLPHSDVAAHPLDDPVEDRETLRRIAAMLAGRLFERLLPDDLAAGTLYVTLDLADGTLIERDERPLTPISERRVLLDRVDTLVSEMVIDCGVLGVTITLDGLIPAQPQQLSLFDAAPRDDLDGVVIRLAQRHATDAVYRPERHLPETLVLEDRCDLVRRVGA